jgi:hypothetical protein
MFRLLLLALLILAALAGRYALLCWWRPFRDCHRCGGLGKTRKHGRRAWKPCRRCRTTGKRLRAGRKAFNYLSATRRAATHDAANY